MLNNLVPRAILKKEPSYAEKMWRARDVYWIDSSLLNRLLRLFLSTGQLHTIYRKGNKDEFQGQPDGDEYQQNQRKSNVSSVLFNEIITISE